MDEHLIGKLLDDAAMLLGASMTDIRLPHIGERILELIEAHTTMGTPEYRIVSDTHKLTSVPMKSMDAAILRRNEIESQDSGPLHIEMRRVQRDSWQRLKRD